MPRILLVDDEPGILNVLGSLLRDKGYEVVTLRMSDRALGVIRSQPFDLLMSDIHMEPIDGIELLRQVRAEYPDLGVIMLTAHGSVGTAIEALRQGAFDYVTKPFKLDELLLTVQRALQYQQALSEKAQRRAQLQTNYRFDGVVAESPAMRKVCDMIERVAPTDATILILGENGTGKKLVAKTIHEQSLRKSGMFVSVDCASLSGPQLEIELFGYADDASTLAQQGKDGLFVAARGGTVLLENVGSLSPDLQARLLQVLQERILLKLGTDEYRIIEVRVLAASCVGLEKLVSEGKFIEKLHARLSVLPVEIPPLRERPEDIFPLAVHFMRRELGAHANLFAIEPDAATVLEQYSWPGNVGELEKIIQFALTQARDGRINKDALPAGVLAAIREQPRGLRVMHPQNGEDFRARVLKGFLRAAVQSAQERVIADARAT